MQCHQTNGDEPAPDYPGLNDFIEMFLAKSVNGPSKFSKFSFLFVLFQVNSLYSGQSGEIKVNSMNAPNNSTLQVS